jgi:hypothetical protein
MQNQFIEILTDENIATVAANLSSMLKENRHLIADHLQAAKDNKQTTVGMRFDLRWTVQGAPDCTLDCNYKPIEQRFVRTCHLVDPRQTNLPFVQSPVNGCDSTSKAGVEDQSPTSLIWTHGITKGNAVASTTLAASDPSLKPEDTLYFPGDAATSGQQPSPGIT